eukprot:TRINITY_DN12426_c0_g1_i2.p1 TRINITY_DN12426_c0_g1~~TRINITY_DN12426_c0_g1_i2.p1  ORF type:complete len:973 (+),score=216.01 TRINITY_DN12426_c0_g1_i2:1924-4842(+)
MFVVHGVVRFFQEYQTHEKPVNALMSLDILIARVIRDGKIEVIPASSLVPGDIVLLEEGDLVPADLRLCRVMNLCILEDVLTGENEPMEKVMKPILKKQLSLVDIKNIAFMTTLVSRGSGRGVVVKTGTQTEAGKISQSLVRAKQPPSPLQMKFQNLGRILIIFTLFASALVIVMGTLWGRTFTEVIKIAVSMAVSIVPTGLPVITTLSMIVFVRRLQENWVIVKKYSGLEALGCVSVICCDKAETLTEGKMKAVTLWTNQQTYSFTGTAHSFDGKVVDNETGKKIKRFDLDNLFHLRRSLTICALCIDVSVKRNQETNQLIPHGDPIDIACMFSAGKANVIKRDLTQRDWKFVTEFAFTYQRKRMCVVYRVGKKYHTLAKGTLESILSICTLQNLSGHKEPLTSSSRARLEKKATSLMSKGLRVVALAYKAEVGKNDSDYFRSYTVECNMVFIGLIGMIDPEISGAVESVQRCKAAGIRVLLVTGEDHSTSKAIARDLDICEKGDFLDEEATCAAHEPNKGDHQFGDGGGGSSSGGGKTVDLVKFRHLPTSCSSPLHHLDHDHGTGEVAVTVSKRNNSLQLDLHHEDDQMKIFMTLLPNTTVFARVSPEDKIKLVQVLQNHFNHVVAITGRGVNDAPALKNAYCGIALGKDCAAIIQQSASLVLEDSSIQTITHAIKIGRTFSKNFKKIFLFILSSSSSQAVIIFLATLVNGPVPFTVLHLMWITLLGLAPAFSLSVDTDQTNLMTRPPFRPKLRLLGKGSSLYMLFQVLSMSLLSLSVLLISHWMEGYKRYHAQSLCFAAMASLQLFLGPMCRSNRASIFQTNLISNKWMLLSLFLTTLLLVFSIYTPKINRFLDIYPLWAWDWLKIFVVVIVHTLNLEIFKLISRWRLRLNAQSSQRTLTPVEHGLVQEKSKMMGRSLSTLELQNKMDGRLFDSSLLGKMTLLFLVLPQTIPTWWRHTQKRRWNWKQSI